MATYVVTTDPDNDFANEHGGQYKTKPPAERRFCEIAESGGFVRLIVWNDHKATELDRANDPTA